MGDHLLARRDLVVTVDDLELPGDVVARLRALALEARRVGGQLLHQRGGRRRRVRDGGSERDRAEDGRGEEDAEATVHATSVHANAREASRAN